MTEARDDGQEDAMTGTLMRVALAGVFGYACGMVMAESLMLGVMVLATGAVWRFSAEVGR